MDALAWLDDALSYAKSTNYIACAASALDSRSEALMRLWTRDDVPSTEAGEALEASLSAIWLFREARQPFQEACASLRFLRITARVAGAVNPSQSHFHPLLVRVQRLKHLCIGLNSLALSLFSDSLRSKWIRLIYPDGKKKKRTTSSPLDGSASPPSPKAGIPLSAEESWNAVLQDVIAGLVECGRHPHLDAGTKVCVCLAALLCSVNPRFSADNPDPVFVPLVPSDRGSLQMSS